LEREWGEKDGDGGLRKVGEEIGGGMVGVGLRSLGYWVSFLSRSSRREELLGTDD